VVVVAQEYDLVLKALAERYPAHIVELVRGIPAQDVRYVEKEAVATKRESDILFQVKEDGYEYLMAVEMQTRPDREIPRRLLEYTAMQHREYGRPVYPVVINLAGRQREDGVYGFDCLDLTVVAFRYRLINLADLPGRDFLRRCPVGLIPLVPLMQHEELPEEVLERCSRRVGEAPVAWQSDLYLGLALLSSLRFTKELILKIIEVSKMEASPLFDGIREKWIDQGLHQGAREERIKAILEALEENIGHYPGNLQNRLSLIQDMGTLKTLHRRAVKARSLEEFMTALDNAERKAN